MQYQIVCHSPKGYAGAFADEFLRFLPEDTLQTETDTAPVAPVQIICFETGGMRPDTIPPEVSRYLNQMSFHQNLYRYLNRMSFHPSLFHYQNFHLVQKNLY